MRGRLPVLTHSCSKVDKVDEPIWYITLKTIDDSGQPGSVLFTCNREEMQQLLAKVKDAESAARAFSGV